MCHCDTPSLNSVPTPCVMHHPCETPPRKRLRVNQESRVSSLVLLCMTKICDDCSVKEIAVNVNALPDELKRAFVHQAPLAPAEVAFCELESFLTENDADLMDSYYTSRAIKLFGLHSGYSDNCDGGKGWQRKWFWNNLFKRFLRCLFRQVENFDEKVCDTFQKVGILFANERSLLLPFLPRSQQSIEIEDSYIQEIDPTSFAQNLLHKWRNCMISLF